MVRLVARWIWIAAAFVFLALAVLGVFLPVLPTTPFVLLAAACAAKGSRRLHDWLLAHRLFGPMIRDWQEQGAVSRPAKRAAVAGMLLCAVIAFATVPHWSIAAFASGWMLAVGIWLWSRPEPR